MGQYRYHVFVCTSGSTCPAAGAEGVHHLLKKGVVAAGLKGIVRVNHAGCMSQCGHGPMVVVYPDDVWYAGVDLHGAKQILEKHLLRGEIVDAYRYRAPPGDNKETDGDKPEEPERGERNRIEARGAGKKSRIDDPER